MPGRIDFTTAEMVALMAEATPQAPLCCSFGPGGCWLSDSPENAWALQRLQELRLEASLVRSGGHG